MNSLFVLLQRVLPHHLLSRIVGAVAGSRITLVKNLAIRRFCATYKVNVSEAISTRYEDYPTFNHFFTRALREGTRPVTGQLCSPADGTVSRAGRLDGERLIQAKDYTYSLRQLLGKDDCAAFDQGSFITIYLAPHDYHRVHMPMAARLIATRYIPGRLFSVNQVTTERVANLFADNERLVCDFETDDGPLAVVMVGAMIVAGIRTVWRDSTYPFRVPHAETFEPPKVFEQGDELGWFEMGSTVIVVCPGPVEWQVGDGGKVMMGQAIA